MVQRLPFQSENKFFYFVLVVGIILVVVFLVITAINLQNSTIQNRLQLSPTPTVAMTVTSPPEKIVVEKAFPFEPQFLTPGKPQIFYIYFRGGVPSMDTIHIDLTSLDIAQDDVPKPVQITTYKVAQNVLAVKTLDPIQQLSDYTLTITNTDTGEELYSGIYPANELTPTPIASNNPVLERYLPYETTNYALNYLPEKNIYVFDFIYDPNSPDTIEKQFDDAKAAAINFIESKGIDINSIVIEWRHS